MEEADLLRERLQAITDKRRVQEDIAKKRREIEEEKLNLQYLKKKSLREQWLMDGLSPQSEEELEAMRTQAQDDQEQTRLLQRNIERIEREIKALETQEMEISSNEVLILKRLKEVEKTPEDIIKEVNADIPREPVQYLYAAIPDMPKSYTPSLLRKFSTPERQTDSELSKKAMYAMEISVEKNMRTGKSQVLSSATVTPQQFQQRGIKVYDDGRKSVYALSSDGQVTENGMDELSPVEVEELLLKASEKKLPSDVVYHEPVFSSPYSRSSTPRRSDRSYSSPAPADFCPASDSPSPFQPDDGEEPGVQSEGEGRLSPTHIPNSKTNQLSCSKISANQSPCYESEMNLANGGVGGMRDTSRLSPANFAGPDSEECHRLTPVADSGLGLGRFSPLYSKEDSGLNLMNSLPSDIDPNGPITMIFMGYQKAESDEEDEGIQAELVVIGNDDEEDYEEPPLSYHPEGYHSKIFQPSKNNVFRSEIKPSGLRKHADLHHNPYLDEQMDKWGTEDSTTTALRMKVAHLGKQA
ncbi:palmdelphin isoform X2 [Chanos chanos]|uniref:Palmdelphin n=1 Tax=Chanos chanos TaxID=29144 RepID=A0A6J2V2L4_CHACN|nr:palmdelphin isoform X2 [Chanos chanos]